MELTIAARGNLEKVGPGGLLPIDQLRTSPGFLLSELMMIRIPTQLASALV